MTDRLLRLKQILEIIPISRSSGYQGVKEGRYPQPIKLGPRTTCWREFDINKLNVNFLGFWGKGMVS